MPLTDLRFVPRVDTPAYVVDLGLLETNARLLEHVQQESGTRVLMALKAFSMFSTFGLFNGRLSGTCASSPHEARLGREEFGGEVHAFAAAWSQADIDEIVTLCDHIVFNSFGQWERYREQVQNRGISCGIRVNPGHSEAPRALYDPCAPGSRLGVPRQHFQPQALDGIEGLHFHSLCEQDSFALERTLAAFEANYGEFFPRMRWVNFGGGHHITRPDYDTAHLIGLLRAFKKRWPHLTVYLEPGEAAALNTGYLVASVLDIVNNGVDIAILDCSATAHMPDVLEMPYRPGLLAPDGSAAGEPGELAHSYRLGGLTCLAGDVVGDFSFNQPLAVGDRLVFTDMAHYTMVKTTTFNGVRLPDIVTFDPRHDKVQLIRRFGYQDFKSRLS